MRPRRMLSMLVSIYRPEKAFLMQALTLGIRPGYTDGRVIGCLRLMCVPRTDRRMEKKSMRAESF
jgi:hypothetical protein